jgi:urease accessory protein
VRHLDQRCAAVNLPRAYLRMDFDSRQKVRSRVVATNGEVVGIHIHRGSVLKDGDCLSGSDGAVFMVRAAGEALSVVSCPTPLDLARAAYHLGNRHVRLQIEIGRISYQSDHVLDEMVKNLGFQVEQGVLPFEPEPGAYHRTEEHAHSHEHGDSQEHAHSHGHAHHEADHDHEHLHSPPK